MRVMFIYRERGKELNMQGEGGLTANKDGKGPLAAISRDGSRRGCGDRRRLARKDVGYHRVLLGSPEDGNGSPPQVSGLWWLTQASRGGGVGADVRRGRVCCHCRGEEEEGDPGLGFDNTGEQGGTRLCKRRWGVAVCVRKGGWGDFDSPWEVVKRL